jgi:hypothetical protein
MSKMSSRTLGRGQVELDPGRGVERVGWFCARTSRTAAATVGGATAVVGPLGHASITTTQGYARLSDEAVFDEARRVQTVSKTVAMDLDERQRKRRILAAGNLVPP